MLRHQRPKSQPPIKFAVGSSGANSHQPTDASSTRLHESASEERQWNQLIDRYQQQAAERAQHAARLSSIEESCDHIVAGANSNVGGGAGKGSMLSPTCELSSTSSSASSSPVSSLASSTLSISTESSTSTVLNTHVQISRSKSMIARYSQGAAVQASSKASSRDSTDRTIGQQQQAIGVAASEEEQEQEQEEQSQALSSSSASSTSSSSGLSSMNSHAAGGVHQRQHQQVADSATGSLPAVSIGAEHLRSYDPNDVSRYDDDDDDDDDDRYDEDDATEMEAGKCLSDLVDSISAASAISAAEIEANEIVYTSFQLHEAVLAQTRSTSGGSSSDEGAACSSPPSAPGSSLLVVKPLDNHQSARVGAISAPAVAERAGQRGAPLASALVAMNEAYLVRSFPLERGPSEAASQCDPLVLELARRCISAALHEQQQRIERRQQREPAWLVCVRADESAIEWHQIESTRGHQIESARLGQILDCLVDRQLVVWILDQSPSAAARADREQLRPRQQQQQELETTLDDIALALDEPIGAGPLGADGCSSSSAANLEPAAGGPSGTRCQQRRALVWLCSDEEAAKRFGDAYRLLMASSQSAPTSKNKRDDREAAATRRLELAQREQPVEAGEHCDALEIDYLRAEPSAAAATAQPVKASSESGKQTNDLVVVAKSSVKSSSGGQQVDVVETCPSFDRDKKSKLTADGLADEQQRAAAAAAATGVPGEKLRKSKKQLATNNGQLRTPTIASSASSRLDKQTCAGHLPEPSSAPACKALGAKDKRSKKSTSVLDLSSAGQLASGSSGLAGYYRSVANRVISNGQSKIRNFKDEMIKLNNRMPSGSASRRISLVMQPSSSRSGSQSQSAAASLAQQQVARCSLSSSVFNLSTLAESDHQATAAAAAAKVVGHTPEVKPRTSILRNKQQQRKQNNTCDINNNDQTDGSQLRGAAVVMSSEQQQTGRAACSATSSSGDSFAAEQETKQRQPKTALATTTKPKSILKTSKSASNIAEAQQSYAAKRAADASFREKRAIGANGESSAGLLECNSLAATARRQQQLNRRSVYSVAGDTTDSVRRATQTDFDCDDRVDHEDGFELEDEEAAECREQAFERLRQRASCYDISRLMSKNGLQSQLNKLRTGSNSSAAARSRQRRPALLLDGSAASATATAQQLPPTGNTVSQIGTKRISVLVNGPAKTTSGADGMVRAKVGASQLASSRKQQSRSSSPAARGHDDEQGDRDDLARLHQPRQLGQDSSDLDSRGKKSEFDPRSLRRLPAEYAAKLNSSQQQQGSPAERRKSVTSIRLMSMRGSSSAASASDQQQEKRMESGASTACGRQEPTRGKRSGALEDADASGGRGEHTSIVRVANRELKDAATSCGGSHEDSDATEEDESKPTSAAAAPLSKSKFSLLRQSFSQKSLSSMLRFSSRASLRVKTSTAAAAPAATTVGTSSSALASPSNGAESAEAAAAAAAAAEKASAIALAEAKLLAAKQLKQQAQKLKEQQKRELQQQQAALDPGMVLAAVQYNQQVIHRQQQQQHQHQHQHQALLFQQQQQYAIRSHQQQQQQQHLHQQHLFDASSVHMQHQMQLIQRQQQQHHQQQQQLAYMANLNSAHYIAAAQQMAVMQQAPMMAPMPSAQPPLMYQLPSGPQPTMALQPVAGSAGALSSSASSASASSSIFRKSILKGGSSNKSAQQQQQLMYRAQQAVAGQQLIPMAVNHHSSFNIVYTGSTSSQIPQTQLLYQQQLEGNHHRQLVQQQQTSTLSKSLGASMRKTVKSLLNNRSAFLSASSANLAANEHGEKGSKVKQQVKLKSVLKTSPPSRDLVLNSEGSDGDGSSSDSTTVNSPPASSSSLSSSSSSSSSLGHKSQAQSLQVPPKSALKKSTKQQQSDITSSSDSSTSSYCSASAVPVNGFHQQQQQQQQQQQGRKSPGGTLTRGSFDCRQTASDYHIDRESSVYNNSIQSNNSKGQTKRRSQLQQENGTNMHTMPRKNVTFSAKLTSIL